MTGYLQRLAARLVEPRLAIRPRVASRFESQAPFAPGVGEPGIEIETNAATASPRSPALAARATPPEPAAPRAGQGEGPSSPPIARRSLEPAGPASAGMGAAATTPALAQAVMPPPLPASSAPGVRPVPAAMGVPLARTAGDTAGIAAPRHADAQGAVPQPRPIRPALAGAVMPPAAEPVSATASVQTIGVLADRAAASPTRDAAARPGPSDTMPAMPAWPSPPSPPRRRESQPGAHDAAATVVEVTIGTVEVRAPAVAAAPAPRAHAARNGVTPRLSLQDYLRRRAEGRR